MPEGGVRGEGQKAVPEIRYLDAGEKGRSRELWEEAFPEDSKSFDDYYFEEKLKDNRILVLEEAGRIDAMIHLNPYLVQVKDRRWRVDYLVGVATRKDRRHRGYMRRLLMQMMADMRAENMPFCFLMPADEAIYRPFGFTYIYRQPQWEWKAGVLEDTVRAAECRAADWNVEELADWMNRWLADRYQVYAVREPEYLRRLLKEIESEDGTFEVLYDGDEMTGMESLWGWGEKEQRLLYGMESCIREKAEPKPAIMARIISVEPFMNVICLKNSVQEEELTVPLCLEDPLIAENDGTWAWHLNHETSWLERVEAGQIEMSGPALKLTITELTGWLFGYEIPEAAAAWAEVVLTLDGVFLDEIV